MSNFDEAAYNSYFGIKAVNSDTNITETRKILGDAPKDNGEYTYSQFIPNQNTKVQTTEDIPESERQSFIAENNIDDVDKLGEILRKILNAAWGSDWGEITPELKTGESPDDVTLPQITFDINDREVAEKMPIKPVLTDYIKEIVNGEETGDIFQIYRQWFDCVVEFNFWGRNSLEARNLMNRFEALMGAYSGYLKNQGISEVFFLKEVSPRQSIKFVEGIPMRCLMYYVRFERIQSVRLSTIQRIQLELNTPNEANEANAMFTTEPNNTSSDSIYNSNDIVYKL